MARFFSGRFPYTNINNLNLDWVIKQVLALTNQVAELVIDIGNAYIKPDTGIPKSDLSAGVQTSLNKADTALQSVPNTYRTAEEQDIIDNAQDAQLYTTQQLVSDTCVEFYADTVAPLSDLKPLVDGDDLFLCGHNMCPTPFSPGASSTSYGITKTGLADGGFVVSGTSTSATVSAIARFSLPAGTYYFSGADAGDTVFYLRLRRVSDNTTIKNKNGSFSLSEYTTMQLLLVISYGDRTADNLVFYPMITRGAAQHTTFVKPVRYTVSDINEYNSVVGYNYLYATNGASMIVRGYIPQLSERVLGRLPKIAVAPVEPTSRASQEYAVNDFLFRNDALYRVTAAIAPNDILSLDVNMERVTIGEILSAYLNSVT